MHTRASTWAGVCAAGRPITHELGAGPFRVQRSALLPRAAICYFPALLVAICSPAAAGPSDPWPPGLPEEDPATAFRQFLAEPPPIRFMSYRRSLSRRQTLVVDDKGRETPEPRKFILEHLELAWQPHGWFKRFGKDSEYFGRLRAGSPEEPDKPVPGAEPLRGSNSEYYWYLNNGHTRLGLMARADRDSSPDHWKTLRLFEDPILYDLRLGLDALGPGRLQWVNDREFHVEAVDYLRYGGGSGRIVTRDALSRPRELIFEARNAKGELVPWRVHYAYLPDRPFPPWQYLVEETLPNRGRLVHTNYLDEIEFGLDPAATRGYYPEMFRKRTDPYVMVLLWSNDVRYVVGQQGRLYQLPDLPYEPFRPPQGRLGLRLLLTSLVGFGVLLVGYAWWRARKQAA